MILPHYRLLYHGNLEMQISGTLPLYYMNLPTQVVNHNFILCETPTQYHEAPKLPSLKILHCANLPMQRGKTTKIASPETLYYIYQYRVLNFPVTLSRKTILTLKKDYMDLPTIWTYQHRAVELPVTLSRKTILTIKIYYMDLPTQGSGTPQLPSPGRLYIYWL